jgi:AcrR family transcriptional regulator
MSFTVDEAGATVNPRRSKKSRVSLRERQRELTRDALLTGASEAFAGGGYNDVTIDDIAKRAGTSRGTFYLYFTKGQILAELIERAFMKSIGGSLRTALLPVIKTAEPYDVESLQRWLQSYVDTWQRHKALVRAWMEGDATDPEVQAITKRRINRAVDLLTEVLVEHHDPVHTAADREALRARAVLLDLQLQYFCWYLVVRDLDVIAQDCIRALALQWHAAIHNQLR